jgi:hemolysin III
VNSSVLSGEVTAEVQVPRLRGVSHEIALAVALPAGVALALSAHGTVARVTAIAFASSVVGMFGVSALFHRIAWQPQAKLWLGRIDHTMIYALIAGTYTPITVLVLHPGWRTPILAIVWGGGLLAIATKFLWHDAPRWVAPVTCVALGGVALIALPQIFDRIGTAGALLLVSGGAFYAAGAVVYATQRPDPRPATFGYHEIFHSLVIAAVACQYATVAFYVLPRA